jgi:hypothetical protein
MEKDQLISLEQVIAKTWSDEAFKQQLIADPRAVLEAEGAVLPAGLEIKAVADTDRVFHLVLPMKPTHLSDLDLDKIAAGAGADLPGYAHYVQNLLDSMKARLLGR